MTKNIANILIGISSLIPIGLIIIALFKSAAYFFIETPIERTLHTNQEKVTRFFVSVIFVGFVLFSLLLSMTAQDAVNNLESEVNEEEMLEEQEEVDNMSETMQFLWLVGTIFLLSLTIVWTYVNILDTI